MSDSASSPLAGVRVLDFSRVLAGPFCTMMLADYGADVIKIEDPGRGDDTRHWGPPWYGEGDDRQSAYFISVNRNKRSVALNLKSDAGRDIAQRLAEGSHIVVENFKPGHMARFGLGYDDLAARNPALVYASITGYGQTGPYADRPGYDFVVQGMSGLMSITGPQEGDPYKVGVAVSDIFAGLYAVSSILAALRHAERTGQGQQLDIALLDTQIAALVYIASSQLITGEPPRRYGNAHANIVPYQAFRAADSLFSVACGNDRQFADLCALIGQPELADDARFKTNPGRVVHREVLIPLLEDAFARQPAAAWVEGLLALGIPAGPIEDVGQALDSAHVRERGLVHDLDGLRLVGPPVGFSLTPPRVQTPPPALGQHTEGILRDLLSIDDPTLATYRAAGVIGGR